MLPLRIQSGACSCPNCLMGMPTDQPWVASREELKRCFFDLTSLGHASAQLENITEGADKSLHLYIHRYSKMIIQQQIRLLKRIQILLDPSDSW